MFKDIYHGDISHMINKSKGFLKTNKYSLPLIDRGLLYRTHSEIEYYYNFTHKNHPHIP